MILIALRRLGMSDMREIERMTFREFRLRAKAYELRRLDAERDIAMLAWQIREVEAKRKKGKKLEYVYRRFDRFFDAEKYERRIMGRDDETGGEPEQASAASKYMEFLRRQRDV